MTDARSISARGGNQIPFFFEQLKKYMVSLDELIDVDAMGPTIMMEMASILAQRKLVRRELGHCPESLITTAYQDGLMASFGHILDTRDGMFCHDLTLDIMLDGHGAKRAFLIKQKRYLDAVYLDGVMTAVEFIGAEPKHQRKLNYYYANGQRSPVKTLEQYTRIARKLKSSHKGLYRQAERMIKYSPDPDVILQHMPYL